MNHININDNSNDKKEENKTQDNIKSSINI